MSDDYEETGDFGPSVPTITAGDMNASDALPDTLSGDWWDTPAAKKLFGLGLSAGVEYLGGNDPQVEKAGYQGGIPDYIASRTAVPGTNNPARRPGSGGQRYFTDINFEGPAADTAGLAALNAANPSLESSSPAMAPPGSYLGGPQDPLSGFKGYASSGEGQFFPYKIKGNEEEGYSPRVGYDIKPEGESDQDWQQYLDAAEGMRKYRKESGDMGRWMGDAEGGYDHWKRQQEKTAANKEKYGPEYSGLATSIDGVFTHVDRYGQPLPYYNRMYAGGIAQLNSGAYLNGASDGMADRIPATIEGSQEARLSDGEFVIPADVVGGLGNGNSSAGAKTLYNMMDRVRMARTGTKKQGTQINPNKMMPV